MQVRSRADYYDSSPTLARSLVYDGLNRQVAKFSLWNLGYMRTSIHLDPRYVIEILRGLHEVLGKKLSFLT